MRIMRPDIRKEDKAMELGKRIRQLRIKSGMTQENLAEKAGVSPQAVSKWENAVAMPDISILPLLAEIFGVSIDDLFDLTAVQRMNRIENRMDREEDLPLEVFREYEEFLKEQLGSKQNKDRAANLLAHLYFHRSETYARKASRFARESIRQAPDEKGCQWILSRTDGHAVWDWNISNHTGAIDFYRGLAEENPESRLVHLYLLDNLIADHRADEAEEVLQRMRGMKDSRPLLNEIYRAHIALARYDEPEADRIIEQLTADHGDDPVVLFEAAQYYAQKCDYENAITYYERSFENEKRRPRFQDELMGIADIWQIRGDYKKAAETYGRIIGLLENEWGMKDEDTELLQAKRKRELMLAKA